MTEKDYILIADTLNKQLKTYKPESRERFTVLNVISEFAHNLKQTNPLFDVVKFELACISR